jgi:hypothetical protein
MTKLPMIAPGSEEVPSGQKLPSGASGKETIRDAVIRSLGRPPGVYRVAVVPLWQSHYRVNVLIGPDPTSLCIIQSYFVVAGDDGAIVRSIPPIVRLYP